MVSEDLQWRDPDGHAEEPGPVQTEDLRLTQVQGFFCFDCWTCVCLEAMLRILISNPYPYSSFIYICKLLSREQVRIRFNENVLFCTQHILWKMFYFQYTRFIPMVPVHLIICFRS